MRPTTDEILAGALRTLEEVILPDLQSSFARSRARMVARMLDYTRRTLAGQVAFVEAERIALLALLAEIHTALAAAARRRPDLTAVVEEADRLGEILVGGPADQPLEKAEDSDALTPLWSALDGAIVALDALELADPDPVYPALRARIRAHLRASLERELILTGTRRTNVAP